MVGCLRQGFQNPDSQLAARSRVDHLLCTKSVIDAAQKFELLKRHFLGAEDPTCLVAQFHFASIESFSMREPFSVLAMCQAKTCNVQLVYLIFIGRNHGRHPESGWTALSHCSYRLPSDLTPFFTSAEDYQCIAWKLRIKNEE